MRVMSMEQLHERVDTAIAVVENLQQFEIDNYGLLIRPQRKMGGVIYGMTSTYTQQGEQRYIHYVDFEEAKPHYEPIETWDDAQGEFISDVQKFGFVLLTNRVNSNPYAQRINWLQPEQARHIMERYKQIRTIHSSLMEQKRRADKLEDQANDYEADLEALRERVDDKNRKVRQLSRENETLRSELQIADSERRQMIAFAKRFEGYVDTQVRQAKQEGEYDALPALKKLQKDIQQFFNVDSYMEKATSERGQPMPRSTPPTSSGTGASASSGGGGKPEGGKESEGEGGGGGGKGVKIK